MGAAIWAFWLAPDLWEGAPAPADWRLIGGTIEARSYVEGAIEVRAHLDGEIEARVQLDGEVSTEE